MFIISLCLINVLLFNYSVVLLFSRAFTLLLFSPYSRGPRGHTSHFSTLVTELGVE
jgi:hypothetical protein